MYVRSSSKYGVYKLLFVGKCLKRTPLSVICHVFPYFLLTLVIVGVNQTPLPATCMLYVIELHYLNDKLWLTGEGNG